MVSSCRVVKAARIEGSSVEHAGGVTGFNCIGNFMDLEDVLV